MQTGPTQRHIHLGIPDDIVVPTLLPHEPDRIERRTANLVARFLQFERRRRENLAAEKRFFPGWPDQLRISENERLELFTSGKIGGDTFKRISAGLGLGSNTLGNRLAAFDFAASNLPLLSLHEPVKAGSGHTVDATIDGDTATVRAQFYNPLKIPGVEGASFCGGYYNHELVRTENGWRSRKLVEDNVWFENNPFVNE